MEYGNANFAAVNFEPAIDASYTGQESWRGGRFGGLAHAVSPFRASNKHEEAHGFESSVRPVK